MARDVPDESVHDDVAEEDSGSAGPIRLQKVLAAAGLGSRRACEELIAQGRVEVDGRIVTEQGTRVDPDSAIIRVDGSRLPTRAGMTYLVLNKPKGVVSTMSDPEGRPCVGDYVQDRKDRLFHVGRLDTDTEGLILLTNDGELANRLSHPRYGVSKIYFADVPGPLPRDLSRTLKAGVELEDGIARVDKFRQIGLSGGRAQVEVEIHEGRNHIVRRMLEAVGHPVSRLVRVQIGPVNMGNLAPGRMRHLTTHEVSALLTASETDAPPRTKPAPAKRAGNATGKSPGKSPGKKLDPARKNVGAPAVRKANAAKKAAAKTAAAGDPAKRSGAGKVVTKKAVANKPAPRNAAPKSAAAKNAAAKNAVANRGVAKQGVAKSAGAKPVAKRADAARTGGRKTTAQKSPGRGTGRSRG